MTELQNNNAICAFRQLAGDRNEGGIGDRGGGHNVGVVAVAGRPGAGPGAADVRAHPEEPDALPRRGLPHDEAAKPPGPRWVQP